jgi:hypothetical protein
VPDCEGRPRLDGDVVKAAVIWFLRLVTGRREPARYRVAELHQVMGLAPDGSLSPGGFAISGDANVTFVACKSAVTWPWPLPGAN